MLLDIISCNDYELAKILEVARNLLKVATILVPVLLVVLLIMDIMKTITTAEVDQKKLFKSISNRVIAAIAVFLVPYVIDFIVDIIPMGASNWRDCWGVDAELISPPDGEVDEDFIITDDELVKSIEDNLKEYEELLNLLKDNDTSENSFDMFSVKAELDRDLRILGASHPKYYFLKDKFDQLWIDFENSIKADKEFEMQQKVDSVKSKLSQAETLINNSNCGTELDTLFNQLAHEILTIRGSAEFDELNKKYKDLKIEYMAC